MMTPAHSTASDSAKPTLIAPRILVAGIGNIFLGDDAFGVEVVQRLAGRRLPDEARVVDFGIRGLDLTYALLDGYETVILVDACPRGGTPGTLYVIETEVDPAAADADSAAPSGLMIDPHSLDPAKVLRLAASMGGKTKRVLLVGCEPTSCPEGDEMEMDMNQEMSSAVRSAIEPAAGLVESLVTRLLSGDTTIATS